MTFISLDPVMIKKEQFRELLTPITGGTRTRLTMGTIALKVTLENGTNSFKISFDEDSTNDHKLEKKLKKGEHFLPLDISMLMFKEYGTDHPDFASTCSKFFTYVDPEFFTGVDGNGVAEASSLMNLYTGAEFNIQIGQKVLWKHKCMSHLWYNPGRPFQTAAETGAAVDRGQEFGPCCCGQGFWNLYNDDVIVGGDDADFCIDMKPCNPNTNIVGGFDDAGVAVPGETNCAIVLIKGLFYCPSNQDACSLVINR